MTQCSALEETLKRAGLSTQPAPAQTVTPPQALKTLTSRLSTVTSEDDRRPLPATLAKLLLRKKCNWPSHKKHRVTGSFEIEGERIEISSSRLSGRDKPHFKTVWSRPYSAVYG
jgi:hypothetical protein